MAIADSAKARSLIGPPITDVPGEPADKTQIERLIARYHWVLDRCANRDVLEVACGTGQGLGLLLTRARRVFACDLSEDNLQVVHASYGDSVPLARADAQALPYADSTFNVVVILEALYFLPSSNAFLEEARRVLRPGGLCLVSAVNKDCPDFNPTHSLYYRRYGVRELVNELEQHGFVTDCFGIIPMNQPSLRRTAFKPLKRLAVKMHLMPESIRARRVLKRIVFGQLKAMPRDIVSLPPPRAVPQRLSVDEPDTVHQVVLCAGRLI